MSHARRIADLRALLLRKKRISIIAIEKTGGSHLRLTIERDGVVATKIHPSTPSDRRGILNALTECERMLCEAAKRQGVTPCNATRKATRSGGR